MEPENSLLPIIGAACFGAVIGWLVNHVLQKAKRVDIKWLASLIGVIGGGVVTALFQNPDYFGAYAAGLAAAFFGRAILLAIAKVITPDIIKVEMGKLDKNAQSQKQTENNKIPE